MISINVFCNRAAGDLVSLYSSFTLLIVSCFNISVWIYGFFFIDDLQSRSLQDQVCLIRR